MSARRPRPSSAPRSSRASRASGTSGPRTTPPRRERPPSRTNPTPSLLPQRERHNALSPPSEPLVWPIGIDVAVAAFALLLALGVGVVRNPVLPTARLVIDEETRFIVFAAVLASAGLAWLARQAWGRWQAAALPVCALLGSVLLTMRDARWAVLLVAALLVAGCIVISQLLREAQEPADGRPAPLAAQFGALTLTLLVGFLLLTLLDLRRPPGWMLAALVAAITVVLTLPHADEALPRSTVHLRVGAVAIGAGVLAWATTWWPPAGWAPGGILTVLLAASIVLVEGVPHLRAEHPLTQRGLAAGLLLVLVLGATLGG